MSWQKKRFESDRRMRQIEQSKKKQGFKKGPKNQQQHNESKPNRYHVPTGQVLFHESDDC